MTAMQFGLLGPRCHVTGHSKYKIYVCKMGLYEFGPMLSSIWFAFVIYTEWQLFEFDIKRELHCHPNSNQAAMCIKQTPASRQSTMKYNAKHSLLFTLFGQKNQSRVVCDNTIGTLCNKSFCNLKSAVLYSVTH